MSILITLGLLDGQLHDGHTSHFEGVAPQANPITNNYQRALELNRAPINYPQRVKVWTPGQVAGQSHD